MALGRCPRALWMCVFGLARIAVYIDRSRSHEKEKKLLLPTTMAGKRKLLFASINAAVAQHYNNSMCLGIPLLLSHTFPPRFTVCMYCVFMQVTTLHPTPPT